MNLFGIDLEYKSLRDEILARIRLRQQIVTATLTLCGVFLGFGLNNAALAFIYPPLAFFLSLGWAQNDYRIRTLASYIRNQLEPSFAVDGWETKVNEKRKTASLGHWRYAILSHGGIFILSQMLAIGIGVPLFTWQPVEWFLITVDIISVIAVFILLGKSK